MGLFDGYFDPDQFGNGGGLLGRLLALQRQQGRYQPGESFDRAPSVPQPSSPDLHSQYQALRPLLGDRNAMLAAISPSVREALIAQALANRQNPANAGG
jgi:hypothetical protein